MAPTDPIPTVTLNNGVEIPQLGFGVYQIAPEDATGACLDALEVGYRHIDTAEMYGNEREVGEAVRKSGIPREEIFITSKLNNGHHRRDAALRAFEQTLDDLDLGYVDLFLIHWPLPQVGDFVETWKAMEEMYASGRVRAIGVSNFQPAHLHRIRDEADIVPAVNQVEVHPYLVQDEVRRANAEMGIATEAWSPIARGRVLDDPTIVEIGQRLGRTPAQITLRWHLQRGDIVFPKSANRDRMAENRDVFGFQLSPDDMAAITGLNRDERTGPDPDTFNWIPA
jgi:2,5-diketo-D-gluconate reductase A